MVPRDIQDEISGAKQYYAGAGRCIYCDIAAEELRDRARLVLEDPAGVSILVYPVSMDGYRRLCRLLTLGKLRAEKGQCRLNLEDLATHHDGLIAVIVRMVPPWRQAR